MRAAEACRSNLLPAPFNLVQGGLALVVSTAQRCRRAPERRKVRRENSSHHWLVEE